ncbi:MAG: hypothetical protein K2K83_07080 [Rikenella sp.]|nr:hypothetical protein [Rikenella sp.]
MYSVGSDGYIWMSTIPANNTDAHYLGFNFGTVGPDYSGRRANGLQLRCLQE